MGNKLLKFLVSTQKKSQKVSRQISGWLLIKP